MGSSTRSTASAVSANSRIRATILAKKRIEGVLEKKQKLASMINRRAFLRRCGSSKSMEATLDSMEMELSDFERAMGQEILGPPPGKEGSFSFDLANEMESRDIHSEITPSEEHKSISGRTFGSMSQGNKSAITRKMSNVGILNATPDLPEVEAVSDEDESDSSVSDDHDESHDNEHNDELDDDEFEDSPNIDYQESKGLRWFDRVVRECDFCIDYTFRLIECDPTDTYERTKAAVAGVTYLEGREEGEEEQVDDVQKMQEEKPTEEETPKKKNWFRLPIGNKSNATIELKNADPALDDLTDSDSWMSEDSKVVESPPENYDSKLLTSSPEEYFAILAASSKSSNRVGDNHKQKVDNITYGGRVMCEI